MLYCNGEKLEQLYYQGKPITSIYKNGVCIYPTNLDLRPVMYDGFNYLSNSSMITDIVWSDTPPSEDDAAVYLSRIPRTENYGVSTFFYGGLEYAAYLNAYNLESDVRLQYYTRSVSYHPGNIILRWEDFQSSTPDRGKYAITPTCYTCISDTGDGHKYDESCWISGYYPKLKGIYSDQEIYAIGDVVVHDGEIYTCVINITSPEIFNSAHWAKGYYPKILGVYDSYFIYTPGQVVLYDNTVYTAFRSTANVPTYTGDWLAGYYPEIIGYYSAWNTYNLGDSVVYYTSNTYRIYTSCWPAAQRNHVPSSNRVYWERGYYPSVKWQYPSSITHNYKLGDVVSSNTTLDTQASYNDISAYIFYTAPLSCFYPSEEHSVQCWIKDTTIYLYTESPSIRCWGNTPVYLSTNKIGPSVSNINFADRFDIACLTELMGEFYGYAIIEDISPIAKWNTQNVIYMNSIFCGCSKLGSLSALRTWDTRNLVSLSYAFTNCSSIITLDGLENWVANNVISICGAFYGCSSLTDISALRKWHTSSLKHITPEASGYTTYGLFRGCQSLVSLNGLQNWDVSNITNISYTFYGCSSLVDISALSSWNLSAHNIAYLFYGCSSLLNVDSLSNFDVSQATNITGIFHDCRSLLNLDGLKNWNTRSLVTVDYMSGSTVLGAFENCRSLTNLNGLKYWDVSNVTRLVATFRNCILLNDISGISNWNTSGITSFGHSYSASTKFGFMENCSSLTDISAVARWNMHNVTSICKMFYNCYSITELPDLYWDMSNCTDYELAFANLTNLTKIANMHWTNMQSFSNTCFNNCTSAVVADFSFCTPATNTGFSTGSGLLDGCQNIEICDLGTIFTSSSVRIWGSSGGPFTQATKMKILIIRNIYKVFSSTTYSGSDDGLNAFARRGGVVYVPQSMIDSYNDNSRWQTIINNGATLLPLEGSIYEQPGSASASYS